MDELNIDFDYEMVIQYFEQLEKILYINIIKIRNN